MAAGAFLRHAIPSRESYEIEYQGEVAGTIRYSRYPGTRRSTHEGAWHGLSGKWRMAGNDPVDEDEEALEGASWTCGAVRSRDVDGLADGLEALLA